MSFIFEIVIDKTGLLLSPFDRYQKIKFITIQHHLANQNKSPVYGIETITPHGHPVMRLIQKFQKNLQQMVHRKIDKEIKEIKEEMFKKMENHPFCWETAEDIQLWEVYDDNARNIFCWHLDKAMTQIKSFGMIIHNIITSFYGDMPSKPYYENCMFNLLISELFEQRIGVNNSKHNNLNVGGIPTAKEEEGECLQSFVD